MSESNFYVFFICGNINHTKRKGEEPIIIQRKTRCKISIISIVAAMLFFLPSVVYGTGSVILGNPPADTTVETNCISMIVADNANGSVLKQKSEDTSFDLAGGMVRLMAVLTALDYLKPDDSISIDSATPSLPEGARLIRFRRDTVVAVTDVMAAMLVYCANDAALVLEEAVLKASGTGNFVALMNQKAAELGMVNTIYMDPTGLIANGQITTARDQLILARAVFSSEAIDSILRQAEYQTVSADSGLPETMIQYSTIMQTDDPAYDERVTAVVRGSLVTGTSILVRVQSGESDIIVIMMHTSRNTGEIYAAVKELADAYIGAIHIDVLPYIQERSAALNQGSGLVVLPWTIEEEQPMIISAYEGFAFDASQVRIEPDEATLSDAGAGVMTLAAAVYYGDIPLGTVILAARSTTQQTHDPKASPEPTVTESAPIPMYESVVAQAPSGFEAYGWLILALAAGLLAVAVIVIGKKIRERIH